MCFDMFALLVRYNKRITMDYRRHYAHCDL